MKYYIRKRGDIDAASLLRCLTGLATARDAARHEAVIEAAWGPTSLVSLSVRTAFDALLGAVDWPPGSEVLMSAVTIPHMADLVRHHGFRPVAVDVDPTTMAVDAEAFEQAIGPQTKAVVFTHLFGARHDLGPLAEITRARELLLIEDCAQCYAGTPPPRGPADVELFSFGSIKTTTCFGGAVTRIGPPDLRDAVRRSLSSHPAQSRLRFAAKVLKYSLVIAVSGVWTFAVVRRLLDWVWGDYDEALRAVSRGFPDAELVARIRQRPCAPLAELMARRIAVGDDSSVRARRQAAELLAERLGPGVRHVGGIAPQHTHWLFPLASAAPQRLITAARRAGFDATTGSSTLVSISPDATVACQTMDSVVYLPVYSQMTADDIERLAGIVLAAEAAPAFEHLEIAPQGALKLNG